MVKGVPFLSGVGYLEVLCQFQENFRSHYLWRERLGLDDIISVLQQNRLRWYGHVL